MQVISGKIDKAKKVVVYGPEGIGKSSLAAQFPNPIFIDTEGSTTEMEVDRLPKPSSWALLRKQVEDVKQLNHGYKTLVIDTIDWAEMLCVGSICADKGKKGIEDFGYGTGYVYVREEFGRFLNLLSDVIEVGINVVLVAHSQIVKFEQPDEMGAYDRYQLKLGKKTSSQTAPLVKEWADMVLFINYKTFSVAADAKGTKHKGQGGVRTVYATHHPAWDAKNRHGLPDEFPLDYAYIAHIFNKNTVPATQAPEVAPADPVPIQNPTPMPTQTPTPQPMQSNNTVTQQSLDPNIHKALRDLMIQHQVSEEELRVVVSEKRYYTLDTPVANYRHDFVEGALIADWQGVYRAVQSMREQLPF